MGSKESSVASDRKVLGEKRIGVENKGVGPFKRRRDVEIYRLKIYLGKLKIIPDIKRIRTRKRIRKIRRNQEIRRK